MLQHILTLRPLRPEINLLHLKIFIDALIFGLLPLKLVLLSSPKQWENIKCFGANAPDLACSAPLLNLVVLSESDAWGAPLSEPESSLTRSFPTGSKFYISLHTVLHFVLSLKWLHRSISSPHEPLHHLTNCKITQSHNNILLLFINSWL